MGKVAGTARTERGPKPQMRKPKTPSLELHRAMLKAFGDFISLLRPLAIFPPGLAGCTSEPCSFDEIW